MQKNTIDKLVTLPKGKVRILEALGKSKNLRVKNYMEQVLISHAILNEEKIKPTPKN